MKNQRLNFVGITAAALICLMLIPSTVIANEITWADPVTLDIKYRNKNKWVAETTIQAVGDHFDTMGLLFYTSQELPSNQAEIQIKGLMLKEYVNITQNISSSSWIIIYLSEPISIIPGENYTVKIVIKANTNLCEENMITETRATPDNPSRLSDYSLFKIGSTGDTPITATPIFDTGGGSQADLSDYDQPPLPDTTEPLEVNYWALFGFSLILFSITRFIVFKIPSFVWFIIGSITFLLSVGWI